MPYIRRRPPLEPTVEMFGLLKELGEQRVSLNNAYVAVCDTLHPGLSLSSMSALTGLGLTTCGGILQTQRRRLRPSRGATH